MAALWKWWAKFYRREFRQMAAQADWLGQLREMPVAVSVGSGGVVTLVMKCPAWELDD